MFHASGVGALSGLSKVSMKDEDEWEEIEVGKGLAQYNSSEIERVKGMKR
jgi:glutamate 5-kinase